MGNKAEKSADIEAWQLRCDALEAELKTLRETTLKGMEALESRLMRLEAGHPKPDSPLPPGLQREARGDTPFMRTSTRPAGGGR